MMRGRGWLAGQATQTRVLLSRSARAPDFSFPSTRAVAHHPTLPTLPLRAREREDRHEVGVPGKTTRPCPRARIELACSLFASFPP
jgi:hypothetical protein